MTEPVVLGDDSIPMLPRGVRFRFDEGRQAWVLLGPERVIMPDEIAVEILKLVDGQAGVGDLVDRLAAKFAAPRDQIQSDVLEMLNVLAVKGFMRAREPG